jgi:hypothetical protein
MLFDICDVKLQIKKIFKSVEHNSCLPFTIKISSVMFSNQHIKLFLRLALSFSFLSAVADRFGWWLAQITVWGNWENFVAYTQVIDP